MTCVFHLIKRQKFFLKRLVFITCLLPALASATTESSDCRSQDCLSGIAPGKAGFLVTAPDRGYAGNQKIRQSFQLFSEKRNAQLVFITDERMRPYLVKSIENLRQNNAEKIVVLPLFFSSSNPKLDFFRTLLGKLDSSNDFIYARAFGNSYLAVEMLAERIEAMNLDDSNPLLLIAHGANSEKSLKTMHRDFKRIADQAIKDFENKKIEVVLLPGDRKSRNYRTLTKNAWEEISQFATNQGVTQAVPLHMGHELDGMMSVNSWTEDKLPEKMRLVDFNDNEVDFFSLWMQREAHRYLSVEEAPLGIVFNAHGADFHWNQGMRDAVTELTKIYPVEFAFSMADSEDLRQAVERLEQRGVGVAVIVRVFGMRASFRHVTERLIGLDIDAPELCKTEEEGDEHEGEIPRRLKTTVLVVTEGGLGDNPLFAQAMLERAEALSTDKSKETVIVVAHGKETDTANQQWLNVLASLVKQMKAKGGDKFNQIHYQTWQEDWKDKRGERINAVLKMVEDANKEGGTAIIIPARTTGKGRAKGFLKDAQFKAGEGFAPHPLFPKWVEQQLVRGTQTVQQTRHVWYPALPATTVQSD